ncbi:stabilin-1 isoform X3 [Oncorhynchus keta]|uniref:stabilin-1 isoform X3 n=1 Tax=Oncorhynchus keta TaxID=8018 RepID=UPI00227C8D30|nr:stabilin-1 isoform X3 [Oncorhynchus keta]
MMQSTEPTMLILLLTLGTMVTCSLQQAQSSMNRCDETGADQTTTPCTSCAASQTQLCPRGFKKYTTQSMDTNMGQDGCQYSVTIAGQRVALNGCNHQCERTVTMPKCCADFWGPLCLSCPSWNGRTCNWHGTCMDGISGNGSCVCNEGYTGFACQQCSNKNSYGDNCKSECGCVNGECNNGPDGNGECYCQPPYTGPRCEQVSAACKNCSAYSHCKGVAENSVCQCLPGFHKTGDRCSGFCSAKQCDVNADCSWLGGRLFQCQCKAGYKGDGRMCVPINPCDEDNGGCPRNSTVCVYNSPGKSRCDCMHGWEGSTPSSGCTLKNVCNDTTCHPNAGCETGLDGYPRCLCNAQQIGDGYRCYGNLMERLVELNREGTHKGKLSGAILLFVRDCMLTMSQQGPFTAFVPLSSLIVPLAGVTDESACQRYLVRGQYLYKSLDRTDVYTASGLQLRFKPNKQFMLVKSPETLYSVIQQDIPAANGVIHIIDQPIIPRNILPDSPKDEQFADKTIGEILTKDEKYNRFLSLVDNCGTTLPLRGPGPLTVFVPTNDAVDKFRDGRLIYMLFHAQNKLQELLKQHIYSQAALTVDQLASMGLIQTMANQILLVNLTNDGLVLLGGKPLQITNIMASNGVIHMIDGVLVPPSIVPILPKRCDVTENKIIMGPCVRCSYLYESHCPEGSIELQSHMKDCDYQAYPFNPTLNKGCAKYCNTTIQRAECCSGFYGPECKTCTGGFQTPCYGKGTCFDGIHGNGSCHCEELFKGIACHICSDPNKHGEKCDQDCRCLHGVCDNRPGSKGACRGGSCLEGYSGDYCDKEAKACNSDGLSEHCHVHAFCSFTGSHTTCECMSGYEGDGHSCILVNPCLKADRGGCDVNAQCENSGPANVSCVCNEGWTGDGLICTELDNCLLETRGGCHKHADCRSLGPGQSECTCMRGYMGDGTVCDLINPCQKNNGGCHSLAKCESVDGENIICVCPEGYVGDGVTCYGTMLEELDMNTNLYGFYRLIQRSSEFDLSGNLTALVPSRDVIRNLTTSEQDFWFSRYRLPYLLKAHFLQGIFSIEDLDKQVNQRLPTLHLPTTWEVKTVDGEVRIENATILTPNIPSINGYIHIINTVLFPPLSDIPPEPPGLMQFLNTTPTFSLFTQAALLYNLTEEIGVYDYTLLLPHDAAVRDYLSQTNSTQLGEEVLKYHVILHEQLFPSHLRDGTVKDTLLGRAYQIMFHLGKNNETLANDVLLDGSHSETRNGVILAVPQVLQVHKNRCIKDVILRVRGRCTACDEKPRCYLSYKPTIREYPQNMRSNCKFRKRVGSRRKSVAGCIVDCLKTTQDHSCCPGYFGHYCFKCPGERDNWCSGNGRCKDGNLGTGECLCKEGFHGTACETCEPGRYGKDCNSECSCAHGKCLDGVTGNGRCVCYKGWRGVNCSKEIVSDACGGICDGNANCALKETEGPRCQCVAGFTGNGTVCTEVNLCATGNGGCAQIANCTKTLPGERTCTCPEGYTGDGVWCLEIDGCLVNNGGCSSSAECIKIGPNWVACNCLPGYSGNGHFCYPFNPCRTNNGGCGKYARCRYMGNGERNCSCTGGNIGDGFDCRGKTRTEIFRQSEAALYRRIIMVSDVRSLYGDGPFTTFIPPANSNFSIEAWESQGRSPDLANYHMVSCETLMLSDLKTTSKAVAVSGHQLTFSLKDGSVYINDDARIVSSDYVTADGVIHYIDKVLTPYDLKDQKAIPSKLNFTEAGELYGYMKFTKLVQDANMLNLVENSIHQPLTMLWPSDAALSSLSEERQHWLYSLAHRDKLTAIIKAHIIRNIKKMTLTSFTTYRTMHGSTFTFSCNKKVVGDMMVNDNMARVLDRFMMFNGGVAYGIDQLLEPPGLGAHCDGLEDRTIYSRCGSCLGPRPCPHGTEDTGKTEFCSFINPYSMLYPRQHSLMYNHDFSLHPSMTRHHMGQRMGCKRMCKSQAWVMSCCKNHYGRDCQVCSGGLESPCGDHGDCDDGRLGSGRCRCHDGFKGIACELCELKHYGTNCTACNCTNQGQCEEGMEGDGSCSCTEGWTGDRCHLKIEKKLVCSPECHSNAVCQAGNICLCQSQYVGDGLNCTAPDLCAEYNGGCHQHAACLQTDLQVNCTCLSGYEGDGSVCSPINRCVTETNGGCSDFATCLFTGPNERQCECLDGYVGNGLQCLEKVVPPVDRCLEENGGCHPQATCKDLHYHSNTAGVFHLRSSAGKYQLNYTDAELACQAEGATLATFSQMADAQQLGMHRCVAGWIQGKKVGYPTRFPSVNCGDNHVGIVLYKDPVDPSSKYDTYCYRLSDVSCVCGSGYVGNGDFCNGDLASVVATNLNYSVFYNILLKYAGSSTEGEVLLDFLSSSSSYATVFVPLNTGFSENETLSDRDVEYHISTNNSITFYEDLKHDGVIPSRLGYNLSVVISPSNITQQNQEPQTFKLVNRRLVLTWDIPAYNGIIHVIEGPLRAPPLPVHHAQSSGHAHGGGTVATSILVTCLIVCVIAGLTYYVFKHKNDAFRFHYFKNEEGDKPALVSIPNPLYSGYRAFNQPINEQSEEAEPAAAEPAEPEEPVPRLLDL